MKALLDTHAAVLLFAGEVGRFGSNSRRVIEQATLLVSPVMRLELGFLFEVGRIRSSADEIFAAMSAELGALPTHDTLGTLIHHAMRLSWTRDPFDRLLVASAVANDAVMITRDRRIQAHFDHAVW